MREYTQRLVSRRPTPEKCPACGFGGIVRVLTSRGSKPFRPGDVEYCTCDHGERRRRLDEADCREYYGSLEAAFEASWDATLALRGRKREWTLASYPKERQPRYYEWAKGFVARWNGRTNLVLHGNTGTGKTGLLIAILHEIRPRMIRARRYARFVVAPDMFDYLRAGFDEHDFEARLDALRDVHLLILDDLGTESGSKFDKDRLYQILNARYDAELPTWITSNLDLSPDGTGALARWLDSRVTSRILEQGEVVAMKGRDLRLNN